MLSADIPSHKNLSRYRSCKLFTCSFATFLCSKHVVFSPLLPQCSRFYQHRLFTYQLDVVWFISSHSAVFSDAFLPFTVVAWNGVNVRSFMNVDRVSFCAVRVFTLRLAARTCANRPTPSQCWMCMHVEGLAVLLMVADIRVLVERVRENQTQHFFVYPLNSCTVRVSGHWKFQNCPDQGNLPLLISLFHMRACEVMNLASCLVVQLLIRRRRNAAVTATRWLIIQHVFLHCWSGHFITIYLTQNVTFPHPWGWSVCVCVCIRVYGLVCLFVIHM